MRWRRSFLSRTSPQRRWLRASAPRTLRTSAFFTTLTARFWRSRTSRQFCRCGVTSGVRSSHSCEKLTMGASPRPGALVDGCDGGVDSDSLLGLPRSSTATTMSWVHWGSGSSLSAPNSPDDRPRRDERLRTPRGHKEATCVAVSRQRWLAFSNRCRTSCRSWTRKERISLFQSPTL